MNENVNVSEAIQAPGQEMEVLREAVMAQAHTAIPAIIKEFHAGTQTVDAVPAIRDVYAGRHVDPPLLTDIPVYFPGGSSSGITFPVQAGDECLLIFADRCIDLWYQSGATSNPATSRRHDLSDGFALVGFRSKPNALNAGFSNPSFFGTAFTPDGIDADITGNAASATKLQTARTIRTNLASTSTASFNGTKNITPGVTGVLPVANGGTGNSSVDTAPVSGSTKMVTSGGVKAAISASRPFVLTVTIPASSTDAVTVSDSRINTNVYIIHYEKSITDKNMIYGVDWKTSNGALTMTPQGANNAAITFTLTLQEVQE